MLRLTPEKSLRDKKAIWCSEPSDDDLACQTVNTRPYYIKSQVNLDMYRSGKLFLLVHISLLRSNE
jgi:hypothetical protein